MKLTIFVLFSVLSFSIAFKLPAGIEDTNDDFDEFDQLDEIKLKGIIENIVNSTLSKVIASLPDPLQIKALPIEFPGGLISGKANVSDLNLIGLRNIVITTINLNLVKLHLDMNILVKEINVNTKYFIDMVLAELVPFYGAGKANINFGNFNLKVSGKANINGLSIFLSNVSVGLNLESATFDIHGLLNNEEFSILVNTILNDNVARFINEYSDLISSIISPIVESVINSIIHPNKTVNYDEIYEQVHDRAIDLKNNNFQPIKLY